MNAPIADITQSPHDVPRVATAGSRFSRICPRLLASWGVAALLLASAPALAQVSPNLGTAAPYAVLGPNSVTCTTSTINGDVGTQAASISNTGCTINGLTNLNLGAQVVTDLNTAKGAVDGQTCTTTQSGTLAGITLGPGVHCFTAGAALTGLLTLNGPANGIWIFRIGTGGPANLTATDFTVQMSGGGLACNVFWRSSQDATVTRGGFLGTILSGRDLTVSGVGTYGGRVLATRDLTMTNVVPMTFAGCAAPASITVNKDFIPNNVATVPVALTCTSGTVITTPLNASEGAPAVFTVGGASLTGTTCTATETVPAGYTANQAGCVGVALNGNCTITNTLIVIAPTIAKAFNPTTIDAGGVSTLTVTLNNPNVAVATLTAPLIDNLPTGVVIAATPNVGTTCGGAGAPVAVAGGTTVTLPAGRTIPANGSCTLTVSVTSNAPGSYLNTIPAGALITTNGNNPAPANATLTVAVPIPTLAEWAMILLAGLLALVGFAALRRQQI